MKKFFTELMPHSLCMALTLVVAINTNAATIKGVVLDKETSEPLYHAVVKIVNTQHITTADENGAFSLRNIPDGSYTIEASYTGYLTGQQQVSANSQYDIIADFYLNTDAFMLDQVVVTGSKSETKRRNSPSLVSVATPQTFNLVNACSLADGLNYQPGVRVENDCQNCGFTQVRINGLDGHYSSILMNSRPVFSALAGVYGLEQIPANMIERVEVMRGGGSALFGSSAIGGTINIITRDPIENSAEVAHSLTSIGVSGAMDNNTTVNASVVSNDEKIGVFLYGQNRNRDGYDHDGDGFTEICKLKTQTLGARGFFKTSALSKLTLEWHGTHEYRRGGDQLDVPAHQAWVAEQTDHNIQSVQASFDIRDRGNNRWNIFAAMQDINRDSYYGSEMGPNAYGRTHDFVTVAGTQWTHNFDRLWFMPAELIAGLEYNYNYLHDVTIGYDHDVTQNVNIFSGYLQNEWRNDRWGFLVGARIDKHSLVDNAIVSPRANVRFNPSRDINFRLSYSTGFRSPQAYDEDFHVAVVGGERVVTILDPNLKHESSQSVSGSVDWYSRIGNVQTNVLFEAFYTDLKDVFALRQLDQPDAMGNAVLERYNGSGARVMGLNLEAKAVYSSMFNSQLGLTWQRSRYKVAEQWSDDPNVPAVEKMFRTPDLYGYLTMTYTPFKPFNISLTGTYTGEMLVQHLAGSGTPVDRAETTPSFFDCNLKFSYEFKLTGKVCLDLSAGVMNIFNAYQDKFDQGYLRDSGYMYGPMMPRSLSFTARLHL